ncbi:MAG: cobalamin-dependent protein, partial [Deltaproteobacteria bacterium]
MRRIIQASGAEVIHLGHNRSVQEIVDCAIQEDVQGIAVTSYQGGHVEYFKYMYDLLKAAGSNIRIFGGGGGTILPTEIEELHAYGVDRIYSPDDGREMGLQGMINDLLEKCDFETTRPDQVSVDTLSTADHQGVGRMISVVENFPEEQERLKPLLAQRTGDRVVPVLGVTGTGGSGKSSLVDELVRRFLADFDSETIAVISVDPSKRKTGGALLGDRIRMNAASDARVYMRSLATRQSNLALSKHVQASIDVAKAAGFDVVIVETSGIGQSDTEITEHSDVSLYVMTSEYGAATQLEKIDMLDFADAIAINKFDKRGSLDALRDVRKQYKRNHQQFEAADEDLPILGTIASQWGDPGVDQLYAKLIDLLVTRTGAKLTSKVAKGEGESEKIYVIPPERTRYLAEISETCTGYDDWVDQQCRIARQMYQLDGAIRLLRQNVGEKKVELVDTDDASIVQAMEVVTEEPEAVQDLVRRYTTLEQKLDHRAKKLLEDWPDMKARYKADKYRFTVRDKVIEQDLFTESLSGTRVPKVALPSYRDWGDVLKWLLRENAPGYFPFTAGVFPL